MSKPFKITIIVLLFISTVIAAKIPVLNAESQKNEYLLTFKQNADSDKILNNAKVNKFHNLKLKNQNIILAELSDSEVKNLKNLTEVQYIEPNESVQQASTEQGLSEDQYEKYQVYPWGLVAIGSDLQPSDDMKGKSIKVAVLDTGIANHPDLTVKGGISFVDGVDTYTDDNGHGTHVAGTIAAKQNQIGVVGIAPQVDLYSVKVLGTDGTGTYAQVIQGIDWCIANGINIISMSFTGQSLSEAFHQEIQKAKDAGILLIAAAGNQGSGEETEMYPALFPEVVSVGATTKANVRANLSSTGQELDLVAPGVEVLSTRMDGSYGLMSGTSMAVPHVTGAAAVVWSKNKQMTASEIKQVLFDHATNLGSAHDYGHGLLNLAGSINLIKGPVPTYDVDATDSTTPSSGGAGEVSIAAIERGDLIPGSVTVPSPGPWNIMYAGLDDPNGVRVETKSYTSGLIPGQSVQYSFNTTAGYPLGKYTLLFNFCNGSCGAVESTAQFTLLPEPPSSVKVDGITSTSVAVSWSTVPGVSQYEVYGTGITSKTVSSSSTIITGLTPNTSYTIRVRCIDPSGQNLQTQSNSVTTTTRLTDVTQYSYNSNGQLFTATLPSGQVFEYIYDKNGNLKTITKK